MPRKKTLSLKESEPVVIAEITAAGGQLTHLELMERLEKTENESALLYMHVLSRKDGVIEAFFDEGSPVLHYRYPRKPKEQPQLEGAN